MKIYFNGDSHTAGSELRNPEDNAYANIIAKKLNATIVANPAVGGAGNDRILRLTNQYLDDCERTQEFPDLVIIGWSETQRFDWFHNGQYRTYGSWEDGLSVELGYETDHKRAKFHELHLTNYLSLIGIMRHQHNQFYDLHLRLNHLKIPHLFFNAVHSFHELSDNHIYKKMLNAASYEEEFKQILPEFDWNDSFWLPYSTIGSFLSWGKENKFHVTPHLHLEAKAHHSFAELLIEYMVFKKIIKR
jgi:hypothetical protein